MQVKEAAPRFSLILPMRYRPLGETKWRPAKTVNVSASGLLFQATEPLQIGKKLELEVSMTTSYLRPSKIIATSEVLRQKKESLTTAVRHIQYRTDEGEITV